LIIGRGSSWGRLKRGKRRRGRKREVFLSAKNLWYRKITIDNTKNILGKNKKGRTSSMGAGMAQTKKKKGGSRAEKKFAVTNPPPKKTKESTPGGKKRKGKR